MLTRPQRSSPWQRCPMSPDVGAMNCDAAEDTKLAEPDVALDQMARIVVDAALEVHRLLGPGLLESVYEQALSVELGLRGVRLTRQVPVAVTYKNVAIGEARLDFLVDERLVVELKACQGLLPLHFAQVLSYLKASDRSLGLLINFNVRLLRQGVRRVVRTRGSSQASTSSPKRTSVRVKSPQDAKDAEERQTTRNTRNAPQPDEQRLRKPAEPCLLPLVAFFGALAVHTFPQTAPHTRIRLHRLS